MRLQVQWGANKGKCGVCGDPWNAARAHEAGGKYANGIIVRRYDVASTINAVVQLTASHKVSNKVIWWNFQIDLLYISHFFDKYKVLLYTSIKLPYFIMGCNRST